MSISQLFGTAKFAIGVVHLGALPGAPDFGGSFGDVAARALDDARRMASAGFNGLIVENFGDSPFFPGAVPPETVACMSVVAAEIKRATKLPLGVNVLRNDAASALAVAIASGSDFIRINVHLGAVVADQGLIEGRAHETLRSRRSLSSKALILADVDVKHAAPLARRSLAGQASELVERGRADGVIVSGNATGAPADLEDVREVKAAMRAPVIIGSGCQPENLPGYLCLADGLIVGSYLKIDGDARNAVCSERCERFMRAFGTAVKNLP